MASFQEQLSAIQLGAGWAGAMSAPQMVESWQSFVDQCENSYGMSIYEYENDLSIRGRIQLILGQKELRNDPAIQFMAQQVGKLDIKFRDLLLSVASLETREEWWRRGVLKFAGEEYAADVAANYGIRIEVR